MRLSNEIKHTDAMQQAQFVQLTPEQQSLEIWLNTRETNGHVADAKRDIAALEAFRDNELKPWMASVDRKLAGAATVIAFILAAAPFVFFALTHWG